MVRQLKPKPEYSVEYIDEVNNLFKVTKLVPPDLEEENSYTVRSGGGKYSCDCYAGLQRKFCRHLQIVDIFKANPERIGGRHTYNWDRQKWS
jgi:hypothetical protein